MHVLPFSDLFSLLIHIRPVPKNMLKQTNTLLQLHILQREPSLWIPLYPTSPERRPEKKSAITRLESANFSHGKNVTSCFHVGPRKSIPRPMVSYVELSAMKKTNDSHGGALFFFQVGLEVVAGERNL